MVKEKESENKMKNIIHINELNEKAYNHLGVNYHAYLIEGLDEKYLDSKMVSKIFSENQYNNENKFLEKIVFNNKKNKEEKENIKYEEKIKKVYGKNNKEAEFKYIKINNQNLLKDNMDIYEKGGFANYIFEFEGEVEEKLLRNFNLNITADGSNINCIYIINKSKSFSLDNVNLVSKNKGNINFKYIIMGESFSNIKTTSNAYKDSVINISGVYVLSGKDSLDIFYEGIMQEEKAKTYFNFEGIVSDEAKKISKDVLRFKKGSKNSIGIEKENISILSDTVKVKTAPILLSSEEDIIGEHGYSSGAVDKNKIFYLMSRGISKDDAIYLITISKIKKIFFEGFEDFYEDEFLNDILEKIQKHIKL